MSDNWYYQVAGHVVVPFGPEQFKLYVADETITESTLIRRGEAGEWIEAPRFRKKSGNRVDSAIRPEDEFERLIDEAAGNAKKVGSALWSHITGQFSRLSTAIVLTLKEEESRSAAVQFLHDVSSAKFSMAAEDLIRSTSPLPLEAIVGLSLATDILHWLCLAVGIDGTVLGEECELAVEIARPLLDSHHVRHLKRYAPFAGLTALRFRQFREFFTEDRQFFGGDTDCDTKWWGYYLATFSALQSRKNELDYYLHFRQLPLVRCRGRGGIRRG